jgi:uncharacterized protein with HEPN domain
MDRDRAYVLDILEAARLAMSYMNGVEMETFLRDTQLQDAVIRRIEIIGEAARRISLQTREAFPDVPWTALVGMRNLMVHDYDTVDMEIVWETVQKDLPRLIEKMKPRLP